ncbi:uncharacterized protein METZ01_LOCUS174950 [marine metagenome]|jgi:hypothetical protein|uniref:Uncharacterized protein n=1 Tax=marine metagenome TaxID=408172 RepID=A0A382C7R6_9ZZZZ
MKKFLIHIWAYDYHAKFEVLAEDNALSIEKSILDKLGEKSIKWENMENCYDSHAKRITYEEVINDTRPIHYETVLGVRVATGAPEGGQV